MKRPVIVLAGCISVLMAASSCGGYKKQTPPEEALRKNDTATLKVPVQTSDYINGIDSNNMLVVKIKKGEVWMRYALDEEKKLGSPLKQTLPAALEQVKKNNARFGTDAFIVFLQQDGDADVKLRQQAIDVFREYKVYKFKLMTTPEEIQQLDNRLKRIKDTLKK